MIKKLLLILVLIGMSLFYVSAENNKQHEEPKICETNPENKISCSKFMIDAGNFSPGGTKTLTTAREGNGDTRASANAIFGVIIKNSIVVFGVLSLLIMTIGAGMMIFHSGQENVLSKGKSAFMWGVISLVIALSSGIIIKLVSYVLY